MDIRPFARVAYRFAQHLAGNGRDIALTEKQEPEQITYGVSFGPAEIRVRQSSRALADFEQNRRDCVRDRWARSSQDVMPTHVDAVHVEIAREF